MRRITKTFGCLSILIGVLLGQFSATKAQTKVNGADTGRIRGLEIVLVVDVSVTMSGRLDLIDESVSFVYDSLARPEKDDIRLITFSDHAILNSQVIGYKLKFWPEVTPYFIAALGAEQSNNQKFHNKREDKNGKKNEYL